MPVGVVVTFPSPTRSLRSMVDPLGLGPSGRYARSTGASPHSHRAGCLRTEEPWTPFGTYKVASGRAPRGPLAPGRVVLPLAALSLAAFLCPSAPQDTLGTLREVKCAFSP